MTISISYENPLLLGKCEVYSGYKFSKILFFSLKTQILSLETHIITCFS